MMEILQKQRINIKTIQQKSINQQYFSKEKKNKKIKKKAIISGRAMVLSRFLAFYFNLKCKEIIPLSPPLPEITLS
jgi:hypothetical protein